MKGALRSATPTVARVAIAAVLCAAALGGPAPGDGQERSASSLAKDIEGLDPEPRVAYLRFLLESGSTDPEILFQLGVAFQEWGKPDSAAAYYERAVAADPRLSKALVNLGVLWDEQHQALRALDAFRRAIEADSNDVLAQAYSASTLFELKEYEPAWKHLSRAIAIDSLNPQVRFQLAIFFFESGIYREALREWERVVSLAPESALAKKAEENITILQQVLTGGAPPPEGP